MKAILITTDNVISVVNLNTELPLHRAIGKVIGCDYIEVVRPKGLVSPLCMIVDEEGLLKETKFLNLTGSLLYGFQIHGQPIIGNIVIMKEGYTNGEPDIVGLDDNELEHVYSQLKDNFKLKE